MKTQLSNLINPEVMAPMISAELPHLIKFSEIAKIDTTLVEEPGENITTAKFEYIGDASDVLEGDSIESTQLTTSSITATVKMIAKSVDITDRAVLSGYGDPVGQAINQITMSLASKIDNDCVDALSEARLTYNDSDNIISYNGIVNGLGLLQEETFEIPKILFVHPNQVTQLRLDENFQDAYKYPMQTLVSGVIGQIAGCQVIPSKRVKETKDGKGYENYIIQTGESKNNLPALTIYMKRDILLETDRDIKSFYTSFTGSKHYVAVLTNESKVVKLNFAKNIEA